MNVSRLTQGLPYSAVLALLGWLMLSQGHPTVEPAPQASALTRAQSEPCGKTDELDPDNAAGALRVHPVQPDGELADSCAKEAEAATR